MLPIITIDGPAGSGKSTLCRLLADRLGLDCLDTGAMYRVVAWALREKKAAHLSGEPLIAVLRSLELEIEGVGDRQRVQVGGLEVTREIRTPEISQWASILSSRPEVRQVLTEKQRQLGRLGRLGGRGPGYGDGGLSRSSDQVFFGGFPGGSGPAPLKGTDPVGVPLPESGRGDGGNGPAGPSGSGTRPFPFASRRRTPGLSILPVVRSTKWCRHVAG